MALPSQTGVLVSRHQFTYRRRNPFRRFRRRKPMLIALLALLALSLSVWGMTRNRSSEPAEQDASLLAGNVNEAAPAARDSRGDRHRPASHLAAAPSEAEPTHRSLAQMPSLSASSPRTIRMGERSPESRPSASPPPPAETREEKPVEKPAETREATSPPRIEPPREPIRQPAPAQGTLAREAQPNVPATERDRAAEWLRAGLDQHQSNRPLEARRLLTRAVDSHALSRSDASRAREALREVNERLVFSPVVAPGDPFTYGYTIRPGDTLSRITSRENLNVDWRLIQRINNIRRPEQIRVGQNLKLVKGPFHAIVYKRDFRMDVYIGEGDERVFVRSFRVGLGEYDSTPVGVFRVRPNSKLINPEWINPRTRERFAPNDPNNPIGNRWIGLEGVSEAVRDLPGYGIHGTIEPDTIGTMASMGCIRMLPEDVELVYELLVEGASVVEIRE